MTKDEFGILDAAVKQRNFHLPITNRRDVLQILAVLVARGFLRMMPYGGGEWVWSITPAGEAAHKKHLENQE